MRKSRARTARPTRQGFDTRLVLVAVIAWLGLLVHNVADLPGQTLLSPESFWPGVLTLALLLLHRAGAVRLAGAGLFGWALLNLVGGSLSVLPLPVLPFSPEQSSRHYSFHLLYAATQVPLLLVAHESLHSQRRGSVQTRSAPHVADPHRCRRVGVRHVDPPG